MTSPRRTLGILATVLLALGGTTTALSAAAEDTTPAAAAAVIVPDFPGKGNSVWAYDGDPSSFIAGKWVTAMSAYNAQATGSHRLDKVYSYGTDMEMYCEQDDPALCTPADLQSYYLPGTSGPKSTAAYASRMAQPFVVEPIIDGRTDAGGYLRGFNELSATMAAAYADTVSEQVCSDPNVEGIQFDIEPFDVSTANGQYWFYRQIAKNFAGMHSGDPAWDPYGCVSAAHPHGRSFSVFTFASAIKPGTTSAANVAEIMSTYGNGYVIDSLYDMGDKPAGWLNDPQTYRGLVSTEAANMRTWATAAGVHYAFGIPASASAHEYTSCTGSCHPAPDGSTGYPMVDYASAAVDAITATGAPADQLFIGTSFWQYGSVTTTGGATLLPSSPPADVLTYLAANLPGPVSTGVTTDRVAGSDRFGTAIDVSKQAYPTGATIAYIANGLGFPDALSAGPAAAADGGPVLLTAPDALPAGLADEIQRLHPDRLVIVGGTSAVSGAVEKQLKALVADTTRIGGSDRFETSRLIADHAFGSGTHSATQAFLATGSNFPDALAAAAAIGSTGPVILVNGAAGSLDASTADLLKNTLAVGKIWIAGGPNAVSAGIETSGGSIATTRRLAGSDRFDTAGTINTQFFGSADRVLLATGFNFPDALSGSAWAPTVKAPLYLAQTGCVPQAVLDAINTLGAGRVTLLGGTTVLTQKVADLTPCA